MVTNRDLYAYSFNAEQLKQLAGAFVETYNRAVDVLKRRGKKVTPESLIDTNDVSIKWTRQVKAALARCIYSEFDDNHIRPRLYRPFTRRFVYFDPFWNEEQYKQGTSSPPDSPTRDFSSDIGHRASSGHSVL